MNEQSSGTSTTLQRSDRASASAKTRAVDGIVRGGGDDEEAAVEVGAPVPAAQQFDVERRDLGEISGATTVTDSAAIEQATHLLVRDTPRPDDEDAPALEVDARHVVMLLGQTQTPIEASWTPLRSSRTRHLGAAGDERDPVHPRTDDLDSERLERPAVQRS